AWQGPEAAKLALVDRERNFNRLTNEARAAERELGAKNAEVQRLKQATRPDDDVLAAWGRGLETARAELGWPPATLESPAYDRLVEEATAPLVHDDADTLERRRAETLRGAAHNKLSSALAAFGYNAEGTGAPPPDLLA